MQKSLTLPPMSLVNGSIDLPGSKSISNRVLLLAALAHGTTRLTNLLDADDTCHMLNALKILGIDYQLFNNRTGCDIKGIGGAPVAAGNFPLQLFVGNSGITMRLLAAVLCLKNNRVVLTGEARMKERPVGHLVDALRQGGAEITYPGQENYPPLELNGGFHGGKLTLDGSVSSQFLTALLIAAPMAPCDTDIYIRGNLVSTPYIDITLSLMKIFGIDVVHENYRSFHLKGTQVYVSPGDYWIEGDASSASYFLAAAAIKGGEVRVNGVGKKSMQGDIQFMRVLEKMGAVVHWGDNYLQCSRGVLQGINIDMNDMPDAAMTLAVTALFAKGPTTIHNIASWRVKESDRLSAMSCELRKAGACVKEGADYIHIVPPQQVVAAEINTYDDHRMAMCCSLLALAGVPVTIANPDCIAKTYPDYFIHLARLSQPA